MTANTKHRLGWFRSRRVRVVLIIAGVLVVVIGFSWRMISPADDTLKPEPNPSTVTGLADAREKVSFPVFIPTAVPDGLAAEPPTIDERSPDSDRVRISYSTDYGSIGLDVLNSPAGTGLDADLRKTGETIDIRDGIEGHFIDNQPEFGGPILWWDEAGAYVAISGPKLNKADLVKIAESMSSTADIGSQSK